jgi:hypothetical protein
MKQIILTIAIASAFTIQSKAQFLISAGAANQDYSKDIDIDNQGNIISAGYFWAPSVDLDPGPGTNIKTSNGLNDVYLAKFTSSGNLMWVNSFGGTGIDMPHTVINDDSNNILLCGYFSTTCDFDPGAGATVKTSNGGRDAFIAKYDQNGNFQWVVTYGADSLDDAFNLNVDAIGNVYWTGLMEGTVTVGSSTFTTQGEDIILGKISPTGQVLWVKQMGGSGIDAGTGIMVDNNGDLITSGYFQTTVDFDPNAGVSILASSGGTDSYFGKYDTNGNSIWIKKIGGPSGDIAAPGGITIDNLNNIYFAGNAGANCDYDPGAGTVTHTMNGTTDWFIAKYDNNGNHLLSFTVGGTGQDQAHRLVTDNQQNIYVTGWFRESANFNPNGTALNLVGNCTGGGHDGYIAKYNSSGICQWAKQFGGVVNGTDQLSLGTSVKLLNQQQVVFGGRFHGNNAFASIPYSPPTNCNGSSDLFICLLDSDGNFQNPLSTFDINQQINFFKIYPNPTSDFIFISTQNQIREVSIYNVVGQKMESRLDSNKINVSKLAKGIHFILVTDIEGNNFTSKFIKK